MVTALRTGALDLSANSQGAVSAGALPPWAMRGNCPAGQSSFWIAVSRPRGDRRTSSAWMPRRFRSLPHQPMH